MEGVQGGFFSSPRKAPRGTGDGRGRYLISKRHSTGMSCPRDGSVDRARERAPLLPFHGTMREATLWCPRVRIVPRRNGGL